MDRQPDPLENAAEYHRAFLARVFSVNADLKDTLAKRIETGRFQAEYDPDLDVLFVRFDDVVDAIMVGLGDAVALRLQPETLQIVGFEVLSVRHNLEDGTIRDLLMAALAASGRPVLDGVPLPPPPHAGAWIADNLTKLHGLLAA